MHFNLASLTFVATIVTSAAAAPALDPLPTNHCGDATAARKADLLSKGANAQGKTSDPLHSTEHALACNMNSAYTYGDGKTFDSANFGLFKNNCKSSSSPLHKFGAVTDIACTGYTIRTYCSQFAGQQPQDWNNGNVLNGDDAAAIRCQHEAMQALGDAFWARQRGGQTPGGCSADPTGQNYRDGVSQIEAFLNSGHMSDGDVIDPQVQAC